jgi:hypothetical protein
LCNTQHTCTRARTHTPMTTPMHKPANRQTRRHTHTWRHTAIEYTLVFERLEADVVLDEIMISFTPMPLHLGKSESKKKTRTRARLS